MTALMSVSEALATERLRSELIAVTRLSEAAIPPNSMKRLEHGWGTWTRWRVVNHILPGAPATEQEVLRYLHLHRDRWGWGMMTNQVGAIRRGYQDLSLPNPVGDRVRAYLMATRRTKGTQAEPRPTDAIRRDDAVTLAAVPFTERSPEAPQRRAILLLGRLAEASAAELATVHADSCIRMEEGWKALVGDRWVLVDRSIDPELALALDVVVPAMSGSLLLANSAHDLRAKLKLWGRRARTPIPIKPFVGAGLHPDDLGWLLALANQFLLGQFRDRVALSVGFALGRRGIDLSRLELTPEPTFDTLSRTWDLFLPEQKNDREREGEWLKLGHLDDPCPPHCPACLFEGWLSILRHLTPGYGGPLLPARLTTAGPVGRMSVKEMCLAFNDLWVAAGGDPERRIGSRSVRVGAATTAYEAGWRLEEIADLINHKSLEHLQRYIRRTAFGPQARLVAPL
jgi:hypothetical protein